jgi:hypothetical protein
LQSYYVRLLGIYYSSDPVSTLLFFLGTKEMMTHFTSAKSS